MYMLSGGAPFKWDGARECVYDRSGEAVKLMGASMKILRELCTEPKWKGTKVAYVSRTEYPEWAVPALKTFQVCDGKSMYDIGPYQEIYPGSKTRHFRVIHEQSKIPYSDMIFFDNERWNCTDVSPMGVTCIYTPNGMTDKVWKEGLAKFAAADATRNS